MVEFGAMVVLMAVACGLPLLVLLSGYLYSYRLRSWGNGELKVPPGEAWILPFVGESLRLINPDPFFFERHKKYGGLYTTHLFGEPTIVVDDPEGMRTFMTDKTCELRAIYSFQKLIGMQAIMQVRGDVHQLYRKIFLSLLNNGGPNLIHKLDEVAQVYLEALPDSGAVNTLELAQKFTFAVATLLVADDLRPGDPLVEELQQNVEIMESGLTTWITADIPGTTFSRAKKARQRLLVRLDELIARRRKTGGEHDDLIQHLMQVGKDGNEPALSDEQIKDNCLMMWFAAYDTTSSAITWLLKYLEKHPSVLQRVRAEQDNIAKNKLPGELLTSADLQQMPFSAQVLQETLRLSSLTNLTMRTTSVDLEYKGLLIPKNWKLLLNLRYLHLGPENHRDPLKFEPTRFEAPSNPNTYRPFGGGSRLCVGKDFARQQILVFMHRFFTAFSYESTGPELGTRVYPIAVPVGGFPVKLHRRRRD